MTAIHPGSGIKALLLSLDPTIFNGWTVKLGELPDVDKGIGIMDAGGRSPEPRLSINYPAVQFLLLGSKGPTGYPEAWTKAEQLRTLLLGIAAQPVAYPELTMCNQIGEIVPLGRTDADRPKFSVNFQLITEPAPVGNRVEA